MLVQLQASLLRYVSTAEAYVDAMMVDLLFQRLSPPTTLLRSMVHEIEVSGSSNWSRRHEVYRRIHGIRLNQCDSWKEVDAATHARNSVAHGLGRLTASQRLSSDLPKVLKRIDIVISGGHLQITQGSVDAVFDACGKFIRSVDQST